MRKFINWKLIFSLALLITSITIYCAQLYIFHDLKTTSFYLLQDIAFVPLQLLLVTIIVDQLLSNREKQALLNKMNMVIGSFYSECGNSLLNAYFAFDANADSIRSNMLVKSGWTSKDYSDLRGKVKQFKYSIDCNKGDLTSLKELLSRKKAFLLRLLENPNLLEHDSFTDLLWAVFHLSEELEFRKDLKNLTKPDADHISLDMKRAFSLLMFEWLSYMDHLRKEYPYLYSLSVRMNPFDQNASPLIR